jgi:hypothetical protein
MHCAESASEVTLRCGKLLAVRVAPEHERRIWHQWMQVRFCFDSVG